MSTAVQQNADKDIVLGMCKELFDTFNWSLLEFFPDLHKLLPSTICDMVLDHKSNTKSNADEKLG